MQPSNMAHSIQIRNVPDQVHRKLRERAAASGLSLSEYLLGEVTRIAERKTAHEIVEWAKGRTWGVDHETALKALHEGREEHWS